MRSARNIILFAAVAVFLVAGDEAVHAAQAPASASVDFDAVADEAVELLREYIAIETVNPPGDEVRAAEFFARLFEREGIEHEVFESEPGRGNVYARLGGDGSRGGAIVLLHHMDVVTADPDFWSTDPFAAEIREDFMIGRGTTDMKGYGIVQFMAFAALRRAGVRLGRDVVFLGTAGEETGGHEGAGWVVERRPELLDGVEFLLTEGGTGREIEGREVHAIEVTTKAPAWLRLRATGPAGHGSRPRTDAATHRLVRALERIRTYRGEIELVPAVRRALEARALYEPDPALAAAYAEIDRHVGDPAILEALGEDVAPLLRNTISITALEGSPKTNVIPPVATAELDCRLLPGEDPSRFIATLRDVIDDPAVEIEPILILPYAESPADTALWRAIEASVRARNDEAIVVPTVLAGFTDSHYFRRQGIVAYGWAPFLRRPDEGPAHGTDERIHLDNLRRGPELLFDVLTRLAAVPDTRP